MLGQFIDRHNGQLVSLDSVPGTGGQSVQLVAAWCQFLGLPFQWAVPRDWWDDADDTFAEHWEKHYRKAAGNEQPVPGSIIIFSPTLPGSDTGGHLSIYVEARDGAEWVGFDANWGGQSAHLQSHNWAYVLGWYTPRNLSVLEAFVPTPIADTIPGEPFDLEPITPEEVAITKENAPLYNLNNVAWDSFNANPISYAHQDDEFTAVGIAKHKLGGTFYLPDLDRAEGYKVDDCDGEFLPEDILETPPPPPMPEPVHPGQYNIQGPVMAPSKTDFVNVRFDIPKYKTMSDALHGTNSLGDLHSNKYFVYKRVPNGMLNITTQLGQSGVWINPADLEPKPKADWHRMYNYPTPRYYKAVSNSPIIDLDGKGKQLRILERQPILIAGYFIGPDGQRYHAPDVTIDQPEWYGVPWDALERLEIYERPTEVVVSEVAPPVLPLHVKIILAVQNNHVLKTIKNKYKGLL